MNEYFLKNPASSRDYTLDWSAGLLEPGEQIATDLGWTVTPDRAAEGGLAVVSSTATAMASTVTLSGGRPGEAHLVENRILSTTGRTLTRAITIRIGNS